MTDIDPASDKPADVHPEHHDQDEHRPTGTMIVTVAFLVMCVFMFGWAYYLLLVRV